MRNFALMAALILTACQPVMQADSETAANDALSKAATLSASCSGCHGDGVVVMALTGWSEPALRESLTTYQNTSGDSVMHRYARGLSNEDITLIAGYLGTKE